jgi:hypothetical protein
VRRHVGQVERTARTWTDTHREEARRLQAQGLSWSQIAERVCGDKRYKHDGGDVGSEAAAECGCCRKRRQARGPLVA